MSPSKKTALCLSLALALLVTAAASAAPGDQPVVAIAKLPAKAALESLDAVLYDFQVFELDLAASHQRAVGGQLDLHLGNRTFALALEVNDLRDADYRAVLIDGTREIEVELPVITYRGHVIGDDASIVRLTVSKDQFGGYIKTAEEWLFIDPLRDFLPIGKSRPRAPMSDVVVYRDRDVRPDASGQCGSSHLRSVVETLELEPAPGFPPTKMGRRVDVATDFDGQYFQRFGNPGSFNRISGIINGIDGIYQSQLNLDLNIVFQQGFGNPGTDPYTSLNASTTLTQFQNWWNANRGNIGRDVTHQFSGKNFSGSTVGIAFVGVVCNAPRSAYGVSQDQGSSFLRNQLAAHEIGHNFSARHDNQIGCGGVNCNGSGPIMCSFLQSSGSNSFSSCSRSSIAGHTSRNGFCLN